MPRRLPELSVRDSHGTRSNRLSVPAGQRREWWASKRRTMALGDWADRRPAVKIERRSSVALSTCSPKRVFAGRRQKGDDDRMAVVDMPPTRVLLWSTLRAVFELGGSASIPEIVETVIKDEALIDEQQSVLHNDGPKTEIEYRLSWARTRLKGMGRLTNSARGVWSLTDESDALPADRRATDDQQRKRIDERFSAFVGERRKLRRTRSPQHSGDVESGDQDELTWQEQLLKQLMAMQPDAFERLAKRLLRELTSTASQ